MKLIKHFTLLALLLFVGCNQTNETQELELVGHRGATGLLPENSISGFKEAMKHDINSIEFDVVISGDEQIIISHEPWMRHDICLDPEGNVIEEKNQKEHLLYEMTYEGIAKYDCGSIQRSGYPEQQTMSLEKPLMREALVELEAFRQEQGYSPVDYNVEIKSKPDWDGELQPEPQTVAQMVYDELQEVGLLDRIKIFAFDTRILSTFHEIDPSVELVYLIPQRKNDFEENLAQISFLPDVYAPNYSLVDSILVEQVHSKGMRLIPWTVNEYKDMVRLVDLGVDGIITDYPNYYEKLRAE